MSRALSDEEASKEMKKMVTFIMQEATEKAKEIRIKADEEFNIEKAKLVLQETTSIEANYEKRLAQAEVKRKMYSFFNSYLILILNAFI
jgi:V-type H+-transporting ATPase subunit E